MRAASAPCPERSPALPRHARGPTRPLPPRAQRDDRPATSRRSVGSLASVPASDGVRRPVRRLVLVTATAGVRRAQAGAQIGPRYAEAMISPRIHDHKALFRHVAGHAARSVGADLMKMMRCRIEFVGRMTPRALRIDFAADAQSMRIVTVVTGHPPVIHLALQKRPIDVDLFQDLTVGVIKMLASIATRWVSRIDLP